MLQIRINEPVIIMRDTMFDLTTKNRVMSISNPIMRYCRGSHGKKYPKKNEMIKATYFHGKSAGRCPSSMRTETIVNEITAIPIPLM